MSEVVTTNSIKAIDGIYIIRNLINGDRYIGMSKNVKKRIMEHKTPSRRSGGKTRLSKAFQEFSIESFSFEVLEYVKLGDSLPEREIFWIKSINPEYNICEGGLGAKGHVLSEDVKALLSKHSKAQWMAKSDQEKNHILQNNLTGPKLGHEVSESTRQKLRAANLGKSQSEETKNKRSETMKFSAMGNKNGNKPVDCIKDGVVIKVYESAKAAADELGVHPSNITNVVNGRKKTSAGFIWKRHFAN